MSTGVALLYSRSAGRQQRLVVDYVIVTAVFGLLLAGLVMVTSASIDDRRSALTGDAVLPFRAPALFVAARLHVRRRDVVRADCDVAVASHPVSWS